MHRGARSTIKLTFCRYLNFKHAATLFTTLPAAIMPNLCIWMTLRVESYYFLNDNHELIEINDVIFTVNYYSYFVNHSERDCLITIIKKKCLLIVIENKTTHRWKRDHNHNLMKYEMQHGIKHGAWFSGYSHFHVRGTLSLKY